MDNDIFMKSSIIQKYVSQDKYSSYIIVIDDTFLIRNNLKKLINNIIKQNKKENDIKVLSGSDGADLLWYVVEDQTFQRISCVISDESMDHINGSQAVSILKKLKKDEKVRHLPYFICSTNFEDDSIKGRILDSGFDIVIDKQTKKTDLENILKSRKII
eukprot:CAMPEP_0170535794 /NCGR_PEP_ID=MMETSP0209-20121228/101795_1 /TAXON_ID=665100 ORGANISM="Litonotus pictus, Strain P1" /NCGR_SAMPLE_ID=MMETSP0209 /ASSEMBLY_ACC=CAM_ASM_000301 /LENGTH=158 /DNA_ID=CAMNT_0010837093 /DNA_START=4866 /DNA_END=5342 /DNA_ORIENTATION=-